MWCATMALNTLIAAGVPQDWATHMIGHEITALHGLDHGQTLAVVLPALLEVRREAKREKLLQYAARVWKLESGTPARRIAGAIARTRAFFEAVGVPTRLSAYGVGPETIPVIARRLKKRGWTGLGERKEITPEIVRRILEASL
jgi:NADP-dependent alcohol dehydrogenase